MQNREPEVEVLESEFRLSLPRWRVGQIPPLPELCFAGRSNVGKSSLLNCLVGRRALARTSRTPGRTQALNVFEIRLRRGEEERRAHFVDLPGYGYAKTPKAVREDWGAMMTSYLAKNPHLRGAFLLLDIRHTPTGQDLDMMEMLTECEVPSIVVATKSDKVGSTHRKRHLKAIGKKLGLEPADLWPFSAETRQGRPALLSLVWELSHPMGGQEPPP